MDKIRIQGGIPLKGKVVLSGAKNAALPIMSAALLTDGWITLSNLPALRDIQTEKKLLSFLGVSFEEGPEATLRLNGSKIDRFEAPYDLVKTMRASILVLGPLVARFGRARVSLTRGMCYRGQAHQPAFSRSGIDGCTDRLETWLCGSQSPPVTGG